MVSLLRFAAIRLEDIAKLEQKNCIDHPERSEDEICHEQAERQDDGHCDKKPLRFRQRIVALVEAIKK